MTNANTQTSPAKPLKTIGSTAIVTVGNIEKIPAKVDTGADSSSIWASDVIINDAGQLEFSLLGPSHPLYTGERIISEKFSVQKVRNSTGQITIRYRTSLLTAIKGKKIHINFTLYDRSSNNFPILLGRKSINKKFLVDVSRTAVKRPQSMDNTGLNNELKADPHAFHKKYMS